MINQQLNSLLYAVTLPFIHNLAWKSDIAPPFLRQHGVMITCFSVQDHKLIRPISWIFILLNSYRKMGRASIKPIYELPWLLKHTVVWSDVKGVYVNGDNWEHFTMADNSFLSTWLKIIYIERESVLSSSESALTTVCSLYFWLLRPHSLEHFLNLIFYHLYVTFKIYFLITHNNYQIKMCFSSKPFFRYEPLMQHWLHVGWTLQFKWRTQ